MIRLDTKGVAMELEYFNHIDAHSFNAFLNYWIIIALISSLALYKTKQLPMSTRLSNNRLAFLGTVDKKLGWILMEIPILIIVLYYFLNGEYAGNYPNRVVFAPFVFHYFHRGMMSF